MHALHLYMGSLKSTFSKYSFGREEGKGLQNEYSVYAFDNVDNYGRPLIRMVDHTRFVRQQSGPPSLDNEEEREKPPVYDRD